MKKTTTHEPAPARKYTSELRAEQADATRVRILEAVGRRFVAGDREISYSAVAREARLSVPTVYRHFPTKTDLFQAIALHVEPKLGAEPGLDLRTPEARVAGIRSLFNRIEADPVARAGRLNAVWEFSRATSVPARRRILEALLEERAPHLAEPFRTWVVDLGVVWVSSASVEAFRGYLDLSGDEAADRVVFALEALLAHAEALSRAAERSP